MSNRISIKPVRGTRVDHVEATDHAIGKKYQFTIVIGEDHKILNEDELRRKLPDVVFQAVILRDLHDYIKEFETTEKYWDCECKKNFIHPKSQKKCLICGAKADEQPDSRVNEVMLMGLPL